MMMFQKSNRNKLVKKSAIFPILVCMIVLAATPVFAYLSIGSATPDFTVSSAQKQFSGRNNAAYSWNAPKKDKVNFQVDRKNSGTASAEIQLLTQNTAFDTVLFKTTTGSSIPKQSVNIANQNNRLFGWAKWKSGAAYTAVMKVS